MKVHVVLRKGASEDSMADVIRVGQMTDVNEARAKRFGILTGEAPANAIEALRAHPHVESVELDEAKHALSR